jgi:hypothetical protein
MNKTRSHLHIFFKKIKLTHHWFKSLSSIYSSWINRVNFFIFWPSKLRVSLIDIISSLFSLRYRLSSGRRRHVVVLCHTSFLLRQDEITGSTLSFGNVLSCRLPSRTKIKTFNLQHHRRLPSPDHLTSTLHCYKKFISTLFTLPTTQPRLYFTYSLARAPRHQSSTCRHRFFSLLFHAHRPST